MKANSPESGAICLHGLAFGNYMCLFAKLLMVGGGFENNWEQLKQAGVDA